ncbi:hypothetical protein RirG_036290 [Rhizophagus irregularis DAOM 197198w]|nr:hypothetical protein RirG_036290 [Rhizophagus irregularis DAOM 197198w]
MKCFDAEINDLEEQKKLLFHSFSDDFFRKEFNKQIHNVNSKEVLFKLFNNIVNEYSKLIKYGNFVSLKHITTGKYLTTDDKKYLTGSRGQIVFSTDALPEANAIWKINYPFGSQPKANNEIVSYGDTISLQNKLGKMLWAYPNYKSPTSGHVEVSCYSMNQYNNWMIEPNISNISTKKNSNEEKRYLKSEDKIVIVNESKEKVMILHSHNIKFTLDNSLYQEVFCHDNRIHLKDEWCIELVEH